MSDSSSDSGSDLVLLNVPDARALGADSPSHRIDVDKSVDDGPVDGDPPGCTAVVTGSDVTSSSASVPRPHGGIPAEPTSLEPAGNVAKHTSLESAGDFDKHASLGLAADADVSRVGDQHIGREPGDNGSEDNKITDKKKEKADSDAAVSPENSELPHSAIVSDGAFTDPHLHQRRPSGSYPSSDAGTRRSSLVISEAPTPLLSGVMKKFVSQQDTSPSVNSFTSPKVGLRTGSHRALSPPGIPRWGSPDPSKKDEVTMRLMTNYRLVREENAVLHKSKQEMAAKLHEAAETIRDLTASLSESKNTVRDLEKVLSGSSKDTKELMSELEDAKNARQSAEEKYSRLVTGLVKLGFPEDAVFKSIRDLKASRESLQAEHNLLKLKADKLESDCSDQSSRVKQLELQHKKTTAKLYNAERQIKALQEKTGDEAASASQLKENAKAMEKKLKSIKSAAEKEKKKLEADYHEVASTLADQKIKLDLEIKRREELESQYLAISEEHDQLRDTYSRISTDYLMAQQELDGIKSADNKQEALVQLATSEYRKKLHNLQVSTAAAIEDEKAKATRRVNNILQEQEYQRKKLEGKIELLEDELRNSVEVTEKRLMGIYEDKISELRAVYEKSLSNAEHFVNERLDVMEGHQAQEVERLRGVGVKQTQKISELEASLSMGRVVGMLKGEEELGARKRVVVSIYEKLSESIRNLLPICQCTHCTRVMHDPVVYLPCEHSYCEGCAYRQRALLRQKSFQCPKCLREDSKDVFHKSALLNRIVDTIPYHESLLEMLREKILEI
eukprot:Rmarinus@m.23128